MGKRKGDGFMYTDFGKTPTGETAGLYTISCGNITARITDYGAALVQLLVPDREGKSSDVVLGYDNVSGYCRGDACLGATVGRNANRIKNATFTLNGETVSLGVNDNGNNLHSGPEGYHTRLWSLVWHEPHCIRFRMDSTHGDQGFPGNAVVLVTYTLEEGILRICYDGISDRDTVFNLTNHSYFNLAGHDRPEKAMEQLLTIPGRYFNPDDAENIPTGELRSVVDTPMDFRTPKPIGRDIDRDYEPLHLQGGYDHNYPLACNSWVVLQDAQSGRTMAVSTDCPGIQLYTGNYLNESGKNGVFYGKRSGVALEPQFYPDAVHHPEWAQPFVKAGERYHSETVYRFFISP